MISGLDAGLFEVTDASLDYCRAAVDAARLSIDNGEQQEDIPF